MVDIREKDKSTANLRERLARLNRELDQADAKLSQLGSACRGALLALVGSLPPDLGPGQRAALDRIRAVMEADALDPAALKEATAGFKDALVAEAPDMGSAGDGSAGPDAQDRAAPRAGTPGRHVAMALLQGLRTGDRSFDARLERDMSTIAGHMDRGQVRPAMTVVADLFAAYREVLRQERFELERTLVEVLGEVLATGDEVSAAFASAQDQLAATGRRYGDELTAVMGHLGRDLVDADSLETLKAGALAHLRTMRDTLRAREAKEQELLARSQKELGDLRDQMVKTRRRMQEVEKSRERLSRQALTDPLTGLWNKRALDRVLSQELSAAQARLSLVVFDIDHFKGINDNYGHQAGDRALQAVAERASQALRDTDTLFRYAGDEFVILLRETDISHAVGVAERVRALTETIGFTFRGEGRFHLTMSLGTAQRQPGEDALSLFGRADSALYQAKASGRNRVAQA